MRYFEDFIPGQSENYGTRTVSEAEMLAFAREFDPQPMHLDANSEQARMVGGLIASGWHTCALNMRLMTDHFIRDSATMGSPGVGRATWNAPIRPGDRLTGEMRVLSCRPSSSKPDRGLVNFAFALRNQSDTLVYEVENLVLFGRREPGIATVGAKGAAAPINEMFSREATADTLGPIEAITPGTVLRFGAYPFSAEAIIAFARQFDPQLYHLDAEIGRKSVFGGLAASGWHTCAAWMRKVIDFWSDPARQPHLPRRGPGFGIKDLVWLRPVLAGDTLTYYARVLEARPSATKPGWGILTQRNYAFNQHDVAVFAFTGSVLWGTRG